MKNINILPTELPSRFYYNMLDKTYQLSEYPKYHTYIKPTHNIYITSEEDINENDYIITKDGRLVEVSYLLSNDIEGGSKIILTTDSKLIKDGVQSIDNEFLEWFVNNQSCEEISIETNEIVVGSWDVDGKKPIYDDDYKIIIPKEEPNYIDKHIVAAMVEVATREKRSYTEEDMISFANFKTSNLMKHSDSKGYYLGDKKVFDLWVEQFKKN
tara:strand:- start:4292 stop:4930 length:639 start_codon:yes stop_codon:yes gene_type:complete